MTSYVGVSRPAGVRASISAMEARDLDLRASRSTSAMLPAPRACRSSNTRKRRRRADASPEKREPLPGSLDSKSSRRRR